MDLDVGVAFVVLQANVILRFVTLDQRHFQDQRFEFRPDNDPFDVGDIPHQSVGLVVFQRGGMEIGTYRLRRLMAFPT